MHHGNGAPSSSPSASRLRQRAGSPSQSQSGRAPTGGKLTAAGRCGCGWRARWRLSRHCGSAAASSHSHHPVARHTAVHDSIAREVYADPTSSTVPVSSCPPWHMLPPVRCSPRGCLACDKLSEATRTTLELLARLLHAVTKPVHLKSAIHHGSVGIPRGARRRVDLRVPLQPLQVPERARHEDW